jgi:hypothetical protein
VTFASPGSELNPYPLGSAARVVVAGNAWSIRVLSAGAQSPNFIAKVQVTLKGSNAPGTWLFGLYYWIFLQRRPGGAVGAAGQLSCTPPSPSFYALGSDYPPYGPGYVTVGQTVAGYLCFPDIHNPPLTPRAIFVEPAEDFPPPEFVDPPSPPPPHAVWFALH